MRMAKSQPYSDALKKLHPFRRAKKIAHAIGEVEARHNKAMSQQMERSRLRDEKYGTSIQEIATLGLYHPGKPSSREYHKMLDKAKERKKAEHRIRGGSR